MKKHLLVLIILLVKSCLVNSQDLKIGIQTGIGTYAMTGLKSLNAIIGKNLSFDTRVTSNFPPFFYYQPSLLMKIDKYNVGLIYLFQSTGSRVSAKDYSGEYRFDMTVNAHGPGIYGDVSLWTAQSCNITFHTILGCTFSNLKLTEYFNVADNVLTNESYQLKAISLYAQPGFKFNYKLKRVELGISAGYFCQFAGQAFYTGNSTNRLYNSETNQPIKPDWNGLRIGLSVCCDLN